LIQLAPVSAAREAR